MLTFDPQDPAHVIEGMPFDVLQRVRAEQPVCPTPAGDWYLARQEEILAALRDVGTFRTDLARMSGLGRLDDIPEEQLFLSEIPEPRHGQVRRLYNMYFGPHRVGRVEAFVRDVCERLLDDLLAAGEGDLHRGYAMSIPSRVMAHIMGLPDDAAAKFMEWSFGGSLMLRPASPGVGPGGPPIHAYFAEQLASRRAAAEPPDDVFRLLMQAEVEGEPLTDTEVVTQLQFMITAGVHTTRGLLVHLVHRLLRSPELFVRLRDDRTLVAPLVEESLRHDSPVQATTRRCMRDVDLGTVNMQAGELVHVGIGSGNRDETVYDDPDAFRLDRSDPRNHLGFGAGSHICPGATLARMEAVMAVETLLDRVASMSPVPDAEYPPIPGGLDHRPIPARLVAAQ